MSPEPESPFAGALLDSRPVPREDARITASDEGFLRGDGVFEVIRLYRGRPFALEEHLDRLERSAERLHLPVDRERLEADLEDYLSRLDPVDGLLRVVTTRGGHRLLLLDPLEERPPTVRLEIVRHDPTPLLTGVKSLSYAANMLARRIARERGCDDALLVTSEDVVLEAPIASFFWAETGRLLTPPLEVGILDSITRRYLIAVADIEERVCRLGDLERAEEAFIAGTGTGVAPISEIVGVGTLRAPGPLTRDAEEKLERRIADELDRP